MSRYGSASGFYKRPARITKASGVAAWDQSRIRINTKLIYYQLSYMHVRPGQYTNTPCQKIKPLPHKLSEKTTPKDQVATQDLRYRRPEEGMDAWHTYF